MKATLPIMATLALAMVSGALDAGKEDTGIVSRVEKMLSLVGSGEPITYFRQSGLATNPLALEFLHKAFTQEESTSNKLVLVQLISTEHALSRSQRRPEWTGGSIITNNVVVEFLLEAMNDKEKAVRERAMGYLCDVDVQHLKGHEKEIVRRIDMDGPVHPRNITFFLGRLGPEGLEYLRNATNDLRFLMWHIEGALAKAGDKEASRWINERYEAASEQDKWRSLRDMEYFGREVAGESIAKALRSGRRGDGSNEWNTFRFAVLKSLKRMYPEEKALQFDPRWLSEEDYIQAEKWAEGQFHISWTNERPAFIPLPQPWPFGAKPVPQTNKNDASKEAGSSP